MMLKSKAFSASRWTSTSTIICMMLQVLQTVFLARLLSPADFGLMAITGATISVLTLIVDMGFSQAVIHFDKMTKHCQSSLYWLNFILALALVALLVLLAPLLGGVYSSPALTELLCWVSLVFPLTAIGQQLRSLAARDLRFDILSINDITATFAGFSCAIFSALLGAGVFALVAGLLVSALSNTLLAWLRLPAHYRPTMHLQWRETLPFLTFGGYLLGESLANILHRNAGIFLGGLAVGANRIGFYSIPRDLSLKGAMVINSIVTRVGFPVMSQVKNEPDKLKSVFLQTLLMTASINFPLYIALALFANEIVTLLYGTQWLESAKYLQILAIWGLLRSTGNPVGSLIYACGKTRRAFWWNIALLLLIPPVIWVAAQEWQLMGLTWAALIINLIIFIPAWRFLVYPCCGASLSEYLRQFAAPLSCALLAGMATWIVTLPLEHGSPRLLLGCSIGGSLYLGLSWAFNRQWMDAMLVLLRLKKMT